MSTADATARARGEALGFAALVAWLLLTVALALPRAIGPGDAGELGTIMLRGGVPHPPGYPWMRLLGLLSRALWAVGVPPMIAAALPCALAAAAGWALLARASRRLCPWPVAYATVALVASAHVVVLHTVECEVFGPLVLAAAVMVWLAIARPLGAIGTGVCLGAAVATHLTAIGLLPLAVAAAWPQQPGAAALLRAGLRGVVGSALGLLVFATLLVGDGPWRWGEIDTLRGLVDHVLRRDYGTFDLSLHDASPGAAAQIGFSLGHHADAWTAGSTDAPLLAAAIAIAVALGVRAAWPRAHRSAAIAVGIAWLVVGPGFASLGDLDPGSPFAAWILERFAVLPLVLATPALAVALALAAARVPAGWPRL
ncbi:MAG: hypothetical protein K1X88_36575, partial [Nannocystaceae bacterium]|nr:hypothetical protein [Nannocystaceae bacterium]